MRILNTLPVRAKALHIAEVFHFFIRCILKLLPLQGALLITLYPGRCPGLRASALSGRAAYMGFWTISGRAAVGLLGLRLYLKPANFKRIIQKKERK